MTHTQACHYYLKQNIKLKLYGEIITFFVKYKYNLNNKAQIRYI